jgi:hypothetical protein
MDLTALVNNNLSSFRPPPFKLHVLLCGKAAMDAPAGKTVQLLVFKASRAQTFPAK